MVKCTATYSDDSYEEITSYSRENCERLAEAWAKAKDARLEMLSDWNYDC